MEIIYEDDSILVVSKPTDQTVNRAETTKGEVTLQEELERYFGLPTEALAKVGIKRRAAPLRQDFEGRAGIVHRLDKDTSGVLVVAKTPGAFANLQAQFKRREVEKEYLALVHGKVKERDGKIEAPIARNPRDRMKFAVVKGGRRAMTEYRLEHYHTLQYDSGSKTETLSFLKVKPLTGRTHQIRVHLKHIGHPVVSDPLYLSRKRLKEDHRWCLRIFLHAESLGFKHPETGAWMRFEAELSTDLKETLAKLKKA